jgi:hypothetical protein
MAVATVNMAISLINKGDKNEDCLATPSIKFTPKLVVRRSSYVAPPTAVPAKKGGALSMLSAFLRQPSPGKNLP